MFRSILMWVLVIIVSVSCLAVVVSSNHVDIKDTEEQRTSVGGVIELTDQQLFDLCMKNKDCKLLAEVGYYEARNQDDDGVAAVMHVVLNRVGSDRFTENTVKKVVYKPWQFSYNHDGSKRTGFREKSSYRRIAVIAKKVLRGDYEDVTLGSDHYHTRSVKPSWNWRKLQKTVVIGDHIFYRYKES